MAYQERGIVPYLVDHPRVALGMGAILITAMGVQIFADHQLDVMTAKHFGDYLQRTQNRDYLISDNPQITKVKLLPLEEWSQQGDILLRRFPSLEVPLLRLNPEEVKIEYAAPVFGASYHPGYRPTKNSEGNLYLLSKLEEGSKFSMGGLWLKLTDEKGNSVDPFGNLLEQNEKPYYTSNDFEILE